jgi:hypothetical protein
MPYRTIAKFCSFVISLAFIVPLSGCSHILSNESGVESNAVSSRDFGKPEVVGRISDPDIEESSGIAASQCQPGVLWTHNDSGSGPFIFALDQSGKDLGAWRVQGAESEDWEDISAFRDKDGTCYLYIGDIGDNEQKRPDFTVYRVREPKLSPADEGRSRKDAALTEPAQAANGSYPDGPHNAETVMVHPQTGDIYILTKNKSKPSAVYKIRPNFASPDPIRAEKLTDFTVPSIPNGFLTGGDISPDGQHVIICDYIAAYEIALPAGAKSFDEIWKQKPAVVDLGDRKQGEAVAYGADGKAVFATSEKKNSPIIEVKRLN